MAKFSLRQAAQQAGVSKSTILRAIQNGRLSAARTDEGGYAIDPSELHRVYGDKAAQRSVERIEGHGATELGPDATAVLRAEIDGLKAMVEMMRTQLDDAKEQREAWQRQAENAQRLLADHSPRRRGWFGFSRTG